MQENLSKNLIGQRIKLLRIKNNHSQEFIANVLKISRSNYSQIEIGKQYPTFETLSIIASYYSKSYDWLLHGLELKEAGKRPYQKSILKELNTAINIENNKVPHIDCNSRPGYIANLNSLEYLNTLPTFDLPAALINNKTNYRAFTIEKAILKFIYPSDILIGKQIVKYAQIIIDEIYIIVIYNDILFCRIENIITENEFIVCKTDKLENQVFTLNFDDIQEIWMAECKYSSVIQPIIENLENSVRSIEKLINNLENKVSKMDAKRLID